MRYNAFSDKDDVTPPEAVDENSIMIFDDISCLNQDIIREYFSRGRHSGVDSFYLGQTYSKIPKQLIRDNVNVLVLFKQDNLNLKHVFDEHVGTDMSFEQFKLMCAHCWRRDKFDFLCIVKDFNYGRYRKGFDCYITL